jgi:hypothetical protein
MNGHNLDQVASLASEDVEFVDVAAGEEIHGRDQWRQYCDRYLRAFPNMRLEQTNLAAMGEVTRQSSRRPRAERMTARSRARPERSHRRAGRSR